MTNLVTISIFFFFGVMALSTKFLSVRPCVIVHICAKYSEVSRSRKWEGQMGHGYRWHWGIKRVSSSTKEDIFLNEYQRSGEVKLCSISYKPRKIKHTMFCLSCLYSCDPSYFCDHRLETTWNFQSVWLFPRRVFSTIFIQCISVSSRSTALVWFRPWGVFLNALLSLIDPRRAIRSSIGIGYKY